MIMTGKSALLLGAVVALSATAFTGYFAFADGSQDIYVAGENVYTCPTTKGMFKEIDCRANGDRTPTYKRLPFVNSTTGVRTLEMAKAHLMVRCDEYGCASVADEQGFPKGTLTGSAAPGLYIVESDWYLGFDSAGSTVAYHMNVGPQQGHAPYAATESPQDNHGKESCYDAKIAEIQEENPNFPISFDMMNELRVGCGLPAEE